MGSDPDKIKTVGSFYFMEEKTYGIRSGKIKTVGSFYFMEEKKHMGSDPDK